MKQQANEMTLHQNIYSPSLMAFSKSDLTPSWTMRWAGWAGFFRTAGEMTDFGGEPEISVLTGDVVLPLKNEEKNGQNDSVKGNTLQF